MNRALLTTASFFLFISCKGQPNSVRGEFANHSNGLMYNDKDMKSLRFIVDSLNLRFKTCDLNKIYYAYQQTSVYYITFKSADNNLKKIIEQIESKTGFYQLVSAFPSYISHIDSTELFIRTNTGSDEEGYYYLQGNPGSGYEQVRLDKKNSSLSNIINDWVYDYSPKGEYSKEYSLTCRYFPQQWKQPAIPDKYGRLILYVDCMIDTSASVFLTDKFSGDWFNRDEKKAYFNLEELADYLDEKMSEEGNNNKKPKNLRESQKTFAVRELKDDATFRALLAKTIDDYVKNKTPDYD
ncbi:MAG TPA: hypothetical protein VJU78_11810, partial [Chitinophagaceae bacterium]|nr:hypothetical protein [Chitinophagaceae bacterium]